MRLTRAPQWLIATVFWTVVGAATGVQIWVSMWSHGHWLPRLVFHQVLVWNAWTLFGVAVAAIVRRAPLVPPRAPAVLLHLACAVIAGCLHVAWCVALELVIVPYDRMNPTTFQPRFGHVLLGCLPVEVLVYAFVALAVSASDWYARYRERELRAAQLETSLAESRLHALELQLRPHFLFNTLNAVGALMRTGRTAEAMATVQGLSELLRYALDRGDGGRTTLADEVAMTQRYLEIECLRFADRLAVECDVAPGAERAVVPALLLQPLAENAVRHGIAAQQAPGRIRLGARRAGDALRIELYNTGRLDPAAPAGIGVANTRARLAQLYGARQRFTLEPYDGGVLAAIELPWVEAP